MKRVGIFAGSFDPVHEGHLAFAKQALEQGNLEKVFFLVEPRPRRKQGVKALEHRLQMVRLAIKNQSKFGLIVLEQVRFNVTETLPTLKELFKGAELRLLFGDDAVKHLAQWPHIEDLVNDVHFIIGVRGHTIKDARSNLQALERTRNLRLKYILFESLKPQFSSSTIRLSIKQGHQPDGLPKTVLDYIQKQGLYVSGTSS